MTESNRKPANVDALASIKLKFPDVMPTPASIETARVAFDGQTFDLAGIGRPGDPIDPMKATASVIRPPELRKPEGFYLAFVPGTQAPVCELVDALAAGESEQAAAERLGVDLDAITHAVWYAKRWPEETQQARTWLAGRRQ